VTAGVAGAGPGAGPGAGAGPARLRAAGSRGATGSPEALLYLGYLLVLVVTTVFTTVWLFIGGFVAVAATSAELKTRLGAGAATGSGWAAGLLAAVGKAEPPGQAVLDYGFSLVGLGLAVVLLLRSRGSWVHRLLALAMVGSAGAFNLQAHGATVVVERAIGVAIGQAHQIQLHGVACAAYIMALLLFPTGRWTLTPTGTGPLVALPAVATLLVVGVGTALLPHTVSCILFFGFAVPLVGLAALHRRRSQGRTTDARTQARLLFTALAGAFGVMLVLALITGVLAVLDQPGLTLVDPTAGAGTPAQPTALLFWFSRAAAVAVAAAALVATRRGGLYSAERVFSRGLASVLLIVLVGGGWVMLQAVIDRLAGPSAWSSVAATTLAALAFLPLYQRVEQLVERLLYGRRPTPYRVLADVAALSGTQAGGPNLAAVAEAIGRALGASSCRLTVLRPGLRDRTYGWDVDAGAREWSGALHELPGAVDMLALPIRQGSEEIGAIAVDRGAVVGLQNERRHLLEDVADSLGAILQASRLGIELERQLRAALAHAEEIAVSRRSAVAEMDRERRAIERDLHDGAQHHLVTLRLALGLVEHEVSSGQVDSARGRIAELTGKLDTAEAVLAKTASGVSSIVLAEQGLVSALRADLTGSTPPVTVHADSAAELRFPAEVEAAVYFCCLEAVNNSRKHAGGAPVEVSVDVADGRLRFTVRDSGPGFTPSLSGSSGRGLRNLTARITGIGGTLRIESAPGEGTVVHGQVPLPEPPRPAGTPPVGFPASGPVPMTPPAPRPVTPPEPVAAPVAPPEPVAAPVAPPEPVAAPVAPAVPVVEPPMPVPVPATAAMPLAGPPTPLPVPATAAMPLAEPPTPLPVPAAAPPSAPTADARTARPDRRATIALPPVHTDDGSSLRAKVLALAETAIGHSDGPADAAELERLRDRLAAPLRVVVVGPARAGTTTLATALAEIAPPEVAVVDLSGGEDREPHVDALVTLLRPGPHGTELARLARTAGVDPLSVAVLAVLNQADEVCGQQPEDWDEALAVAVACQQDPDLQRIGQPVTPVIGRLALGALELTEDDVAALRELGDAAEDADAALLDRLGLFGVRHAVTLLRSGAVHGRDDLALELATTSGLIWLAEALRGQFARRAQALRARSAMVEMESLVSRRPDTAEPVLYRLEELRAGTHELAEIELADALANGSMVLLGSDRNAALRLLGTADSRPTARLGLPDDASPEDLRTAVTEELSHWRRQAAHPAATSSVRRAAEILVRTCEALLAQTLTPHN
jgi:signal transduction histidine kinase